MHFLVKDYFFQENACNLFTYHLLPRQSPNLKIICVFAVKHRNNLFYIRQRKLITAPMGHLNTSEFQQDKAKLSETYTHSYN